MNTLDSVIRRRNPASLTGLLFVIAIHAALFYVLWSQRLIPAPEKMETLFVNFISPPKPEEPQIKPPPPAKPKPVKQPERRQLVAETPIVKHNDMVAPPPPVVVTEPEPVAKPAPQMPPGPVMMTSELSVACPELNAPSYPSVSRKLGEEGKLVLRVELDESGHVSTVRVTDSSGYKRLDEAAIAAVKTWHCTPPRRDGKPVRAIALQPFNFQLDGD